MNQVVPVRKDVVLYRFIGPGYETLVRRHEIDAQEIMMREGDYYRDQLTAFAQKNPR